jgi:hypothetical protein
MFIDSMDNVKLHRLPAAMMALLMTTALVLGLSTAACNEKHDEDVDIVNKLVLTIPINDGEQEADTCAPETVTKYQVCGFDEDGNATYSKEFNRDKSNTKDNVTSITLRRGRDINGTEGITYGTKTILINYLDEQDFLGYTLFTNLDLRSDAYKEIIVNKVFLAGLAKQTDALGLALTSNIQTSADTASKDDIAEETETTEGCEAVVDDTVNIFVKLNAKTNPGVTDEYITVDLTDTTLVTFTITSDVPDDEQSEDPVIKEWAEQPGSYRCISAGVATINATYSTLTADNPYEITVVDHDIVGTVYVTIDDAVAALFPAQIAYAKVKGSSEKANVTDNMFTLNNMYTSYHNKTVTFYDAEDNELGTGSLPPYKITVNGDTANVTITTEE